MNVHACVHTFAATAIHTPDNDYDECTAGNGRPCSDGERCAIIGLGNVRQCISSKFNTCMQTPLCTFILEIDMSSFSSA